MDSAWCSSCSATYYVNSEICWFQILCGFSLLSDFLYTDFELRKDAFIRAGALPILISLHSRLTRDKDNSEVVSYDYLDLAISALNHE